MLRFDLVWMERFKWALTKSGWSIREQQGLDKDLKRTRVLTGRRCKMSVITSIGSLDILMVWVLRVTSFWIQVFEMVWGVVWIWFGWPENEGIVTLEEENVR